MPMYNEGDYVIPVEELISASSDIFYDILDFIVSSSDCRCTIVDHPSTITIELDKYLIDIVIGQGSIVCNKSCALENIYVRTYRIASPGWVYGRPLNPREECLTVPETLGLINDIRPLAKYVSWRLSNFDEILEKVSRERTYSFMFLSPRVDPLRFYETRCCGELSTPNPLHPGAVWGKTKEKVCTRCVRAIGPLEPKLSPLLLVNNSPILSIYRGMGEALLAGIVDSDMPSVVAKAISLAALYTCSRGE